MKAMPPADPRLSALLAERWGEHLAPGERFEGTTSREPELVRVLLTVVAADEVERHEFEARVEVGPRTQAEALDSAVDAADAVLAQWLEAGRPRLPGVPESCDFHGIPVEIHARLLRPAIEAAADSLLGETAGDDEPG